MSDLVGTRWVENDRRFERIVEVVEVKTPPNKDQRVFRRTISFDGKPPRGDRVTSGDFRKFLKRFRPMEGEGG